MSHPAGPRVRSVNVGRPKPAAYARPGATAIDKAPQAGPVAVRTLGLAGDQVADTVHHGGPDQAVYAFAREDLDSWADRLGRPIRDGLFGENLTTVGIDVSAAELGERWRIGSALLEVCSVRTPCNVFKQWLGLSGFDNEAWVRRFTLEARPGAYVRVLEEGELTAGDSVEVVHRPGHGLTVSEMFRALHLDRSLLPRLLEVDAVCDEARRKAASYAASLV